MTILMKNKSIERRPCTTNGLSHRQLPAAAALRSLRKRGTLHAVVTSATQTGDNYLPCQRRGIARRMRRNNAAYRRRRAMFQRLIVCLRGEDVGLASVTAPRNEPRRQSGSREEEIMSKDESRGGVREGDGTVFHVLSTAAETRLNG